MSEQFTIPELKISLNYDEAVGLIYTVIESTQEFLRAYDSNDGRRLTEALRSAFRLVEAMHRPDADG